MKTVWDELPKPFFVLAPMEAVTDVIFRHVVAKAGAPDLWFSEFTNATGWVHAGEKAIRGRLYKTDDEKPIIAQIWGGEPSDMEKLAHYCKELGYDGIDINMGCPAKSAIKSGGSALIRNPSLAIAAIAAAKTAGLPVSVKTRLGYTHVDEWKEWLTILLQQDIAALTIHLRTKKEMSKVSAHWELMPEVKALRDTIAPQTLLIGNGDVRNIQHGHKLIRETGIDGIMIGRGIFHNPYAFSTNTDIYNDVESTTDLANPYESVATNVATKTRLDLLRYHLDLFDEYQPVTTRPYETLKRFFKVYVRDFNEASSLRSALMITESTRQAREIITNYYFAKNIELTDMKGYSEPMKDNIKAIIFDSDGTLLDTRQLIFEGYKRILENNNLSHLANDHYIRQRLGKPTLETCEQLIAGHKTKITAKELASQLDDVQESILHYIKPYPHTRELLERWKNNGVKLCLFSSGYNYMIDRNFTAAGIPDVRELFDAIVTADDGLPLKPEPNAITELLDKVGVEASNAVVVGDHSYDIIAAKRAEVGLKVGILHGVGTQHELLSAGADFLCDNLGSLNHLTSFAKNESGS